nr:immunoglobulin heavy chain junction region [Macaca mulatta]
CVRVGAATSLPFDYW